MTELGLSDIETLRSPDSSEIEKRVEALSPSDLETMEKLTAEKNAEALQNRRLLEEKFPGSVEPTALVAPETEYAIKSYFWSYVAGFYIRVWCTVTYETGEVRTFAGDGGGVGAGWGTYVGAAPNTNFSLSPGAIVGTSSSWQMGSAAIGAYITFWTPSGSIGTLVGAGPAIGTGLYGGGGTWYAA